MKYLNNLPLLVVVGSTASGKTAASIEIANKLREMGIESEIITADSRTIYRGMDIGTAKIRENEMDGFKHWGIDLINPDKKFTVADFQKYANDKIREIREREHLPIMVGGSGLYVDSVVFNYNFAKNSDSKIREELNNKTVQELQKIIIEHKIYMPENRENKRYLIRAIEKNDVKESTSNRDKIRENTIIVGISTERDILRSRIEKRVAEMLESAELKIETERIFANYSADSEPLKSNIYRFAKKYYDGELTLEKSKELASIADWRLAKKQMTWFRRNREIHWKDLSSIVEFSICEIKKMIN